MEYSYGRPASSGSVFELLGEVADRDLAKLSCSTVPLLSFISNEARVAALAERLGFDKAMTHAALEFSVRAGCRECGGRGKSSFTDLMLERRAGEVVEDCLAIEAKHTEGLYGTVRDWLTPDTANRRSVLRHWWHLIRGRSCEDFPLADLLDVEYQMLHRTASAASRGASHRSVVLHLLLTDDETKLGTYASPLRSLGKVLPKDSRLELWVAQVGTRLSSVGRDLESRLPEGESETVTVVRDALASGADLYDFSAETCWDVRRA